METRQTDVWCDCTDAPTAVRGSATFLGHPSGCDFPTGVCQVRAHRVTVHAACGRELPIRFCACPPSGYQFDRERRWWVHSACSWPTKVWYEKAGQPAPDHLRGVRPVILHDFVGVPRGSSLKPDPLTPEQRRRNDAQIGRPVWD